MSTDYCDEDIVHLYQEFVKSTLFQFIQDSVLRYTGDVRGKSILDMGCGLGSYCRLLKQMGAARVVGVDISEPMIQTAQQYEKRSPLGIEYLVADCMQMDVLGQFDYVLVNFVFIYAKDREQLESVVRKIHNNLKVGGHMIAINPDTTQREWHPSITEMFGVSLTEIKFIPDGFRGKLSIVVESDEINASIYLLEPRVYEEIFRAAGLKQLAFNPRYVREDTSIRFPQNYSDIYLRNGYVIVITATK